MNKEKKEKLIKSLIELCDDERIKSNMDIDLFETGLLDSLAFTELLIIIEEEFGVIIAPSEVERKDINTPNKIIKIIERRLTK